MSDQLLLFILLEHISVNNFYWLIYINVQIMLIFAVAVAALKLRTTIPCPVTARTKQPVSPVPDILLPIILYPSGIKSFGNAIVTSLLPEMLVLEETKSFTINFSFSSLGCFKKGGSYDQSTDPLNMMFLGSRTGGFYYARKELIKLDTSQIWTIILATGIPSALVALMIRRFEARMDAKEKAREKQELLLV